MDKLLKQGKQIQKVLKKRRAELEQKEETIKKNRKKINKDAARRRDLLLNIQKLLKKSSSLDSNSPHSEEIVWMKDGLNSMKTFLEEQRLVLEQLESDRKKTQTLETSITTFMDHTLKRLQDLKRHRLSIVGHRPNGPGS